jgi:hypothetical protein
MLPTLGISAMAPLEAALLLLIDMRVPPFVSNRKFSDATALLQVVQGAKLSNPIKLAVLDLPKVKTAPGRFIYSFLRTFRTMTKDARTDLAGGSYGTAGNLADVDKLIDQYASLLSYVTNVGNKAAKGALPPDQKKFDLPVLKELDRLVAGLLQSVGATVLGGFCLVAGAAALGIKAMVHEEAGRALNDADQREPGRLYAQAYRDFLNGHGPSITVKDAAIAGINLINPPAGAMIEQVDSATQRIGQRLQDVGRLTGYPRDAIQVGLGDHQDRVAGGFVRQGRWRAAVVRATPDTVVVAFRPFFGAERRAILHRERRC